MELQTEKEKLQIEEFRAILEKIAGWSSILILFVCVIITFFYFTLKNKNKNKSKSTKDFYSNISIKDNQVIRILLFVIMFNLIIPLVGSLIIYYSLKSYYEEINTDKIEKFKNIAEIINGLSINCILILSVFFIVIIKEHNQGRLVGRLI
jgi:hypothetical protein